MLVHGAVLALRYGTETASLWGDWIDTAAPLHGGRASAGWFRARPGPLAGGFGAWSLSPACSTAIGQALYTDYYDYLHAPLGTLVAERRACLLLGRARHDDAVSESAGPRQRIRLVARLRFCAGLHACAGCRVVANLRAFALAGSGTGDAGPRAACRNPFLWAGGFEFSGSRPAEFQSHRESILPAHGRLPGRPRNRSQCHALPIRRPDTISRGTWPDLSWTLSFCLLIVIAGTWNDREEPVGRESSSPMACSCSPNFLRC